MARFWGFMQALSRTTYRFDNFELDVGRRRLLRDGRSVSLNPKAFDMLRVLVEHNGTLVTKEDLFRHVWEDQIVEESNLTVNMSAIRKALGETATRPHYITTVSGRGYYFTADLETADALVKNDDVIVETRAVTSIVVEEFDPRPDIPSEKIARTLPVGRSGVRLWPFVAFGALLLIAAGLAYWLLVVRQVRTLVPFQKQSVKRLTTSGRVTNAALSPDGKLFAYSQEEPDGRSTLRLEHIDGSSHVELRPALFVSYISINFTPDGSRIYYGIIGDEPGTTGVYRLPVFGGAPEKIKDGFWSRTAFSPDGSQMAFVSLDPATKLSSLRVTDPQWQSEREIASRPASNAFIGATLDWAPDGRRIAVSAINDEATQKQELFVVDVQDGSVNQLTRSGWDGIRAVTWLADGDGLIATAGSQDVGWDSKLWHISESDGHAERIVSDLNTYGIVARLSADKKVLLTVQAQFYSNLWIAPSDNLSQARQLTHDMLGGQNGWYGLEWQPDGRILYTSYRNKTETIWMIDGNGENPRQIIPDGGRNYNVSSSADGRLIVFDSDRSGTDEIWIANGDGTGMRQLTKDGNNVQPHISPDGNWVIYQSARNDVTSLWKAPTDGRAEPVQFTNTPAGWARISADGQSVAAHCTVDGRSRLCIFSSFGGDPIKQFDVPPRANFRLGVHWTPDGTAVAYRDWGYGIWKQNLSGGEPVRLEGLPQEKLFGFGWSKDGKQFAYARGMAIQDLVLITNED